MKIPIISVFYRYFRVFYEYTGYRLFLFVTVIFATGVIEGLGLSIAMPLINFAASGKETTDRFSQYIEKILLYFNLTPNLKSIVVLMISVFFIRGVLFFAQQAYQYVIVSELFEKVQRKLIERCCDVDYPYFITFRIGNLNNAVSVEANRFASAFKHLCMFSASMINGAIYYLFAIAINAKYAIVITIVGVLIYALFYKIRKKIRKLSNDSTKYNKQSQNLAIQFIYNYKYLKATGQVLKVKKKLFDVFKNTKVVSVIGESIKAFSNSTTQFMTIAIILCSFYYLIAVDGLSFAEVVIPLLFMHRTFAAFYALTNRWQSFLSLTGSIGEVNKTTLNLSSHKEQKGVKLSFDFKKSIVLKNVSFYFDKKNILDNISLEIKKYQTIGIAGKSGSGKTTLLDILTSLLKPSSGEIFMDDIAYSNLSKDGLRDKFSYITQEPAIFNDTIANNITLWSSNFNFETENKALLRASKSAHCNEFIEETNRQYDEVIGDKGVRLSGGQRQRICIAREIFRDRDILIFDEATSALDTKSENLIQKSIEEISGRKTMVLVAHRLSTLRTCDVIYVMEKGSIVEKGSWESLVENKNTLFAAMLSLQNPDEYRRT